jgi:hypothetical protein
MELSRDDQIDLKVLIEYIKNELFTKAKFVLGKDDWDVGGIIYKDYIKCCRGRIGQNTMSEADRETRMEKIWMRALNKKIQKKSLVQKRSAIYTVMQNKFAGNSLCCSRKQKPVKFCILFSPPVTTRFLLFFLFLSQDLCKLCVELKCVLPSMESLKRRLHDPKAYCVFYMYFYTAAVGDTHWKECLSKEGGRIGSNTTEAFALLLLDNNYKAWLYEEKKIHQSNLLTEYEIVAGPEYGKMSIVDKILDGVQINLEKDASTTLIYDKDHRDYKRLQKKRIDWLKHFFKSGPCKKVNDGVLKKASSSSGDGHEEEPQQGQDDNGGEIVLKERAKKKRKLTRELREFTGSSGGGRKHKGWSDEGMVAFEEYVKAIRKDVQEGKYEPWEKAYRGVMDRLGHLKRNNNNDVQLPRYEQNIEVVWEGF